MRQTSYVNNSVVTASNSCSSVSESCTTCISAVIVTMLLFLSSEVSVRKTMSGYLPLPSAHLSERELIGNEGMATNIDLSGLTPHEIAKIQQVMLRANKASKEIEEQAG